MKKTDRQMTLRELASDIPTEAQVQRLADFFSVFGDSTRMRIVSALRKQELNVGELAEVLGMSVSAVSHQLRGLRRQDLVRSRRDGRFVYYRLSDEHVTVIYDMGLSHLREQKDFGGK